MDSTSEVDTIVVFCWNSACNSSCDAMLRRGPKTNASFLPLQVQEFLCNRSFEGTFLHVSSVVTVASIAEDHGFEDTHAPKTSEFWISNTNALKT